MTHIVFICVFATIIHHGHGRFRQPPLLHGKALALIAAAAHLYLLTFMPLSLPPFGAATVLLAGLPTTCHPILA
ncbi:hypothetical protein [Oryza sativa Japonica Group]|uniref:Uncharacterized protein n=1 Tax=Oryza sativa subsp. japonica TaxID=39947 RepID=Q657U3_ORYSJ|nr:hypothetical protein [Oryza sativa Japonica Group]BAD44919.1 hypothetical protein [Oryza sativa Japonica Group]